MSFEAADYPLIFGLDVCRDLARSSRLGCSEGCRGGCVLKSYPEAEEFAALLFEVRNPIA